MEQALNMARTACRALEDKKGEDIRLLDISHISVMTDYFVITNGNSDSQTKALVENVEEKMEQAGYALRQQEGKGSAWILLDYGDVIVHIFDQDSRAFYNLERIWSDAKPAK